mmetsp:Transcript_11449/g.32963  ORF Transcript_11449/g.32963 Transcript_11449/m.32963 type:complete len:307 (+) Transcript_11449:242-1162(+)
MSHDGGSGANDLAAPVEERWWLEVVGKDEGAVVAAGDLGHVPPGAAQFLQQSGEVLVGGHAVPKLALGACAEGEYFTRVAQSHRVLPSAGDLNDALATEAIHGQEVRLERVVSFVAGKFRRVTKAQLALKVSPADVDFPCRRQHGAVAPARNNLADAEVPQGRDGLGGGQKVGALDVARNHGRVRVSELTDAVVPPGVHFLVHREGDRVVATRPDRNLINPLVVEGVKEPRQEHIFAGPMAGVLVLAEGVHRSGAGEDTGVDGPGEDVLDGSVHKLLDMAWHVPVLSFPEAQAAILPGAPGVEVST